MTEVKQSKTESATINNRLRNVTEWPSTTVVTNPTRTITNVYPGGYQSQKGDQPKTGEPKGGWPLG